MYRPRWRKVVADLWSNKIRTLLVMLSIAVGVFAVGFVNSSFSIVLKDMEADFQAVNPYGAIIFCDPFKDEFVESLKLVKGVGEIEGRQSISVRLEISKDKKIPMEIMAIPPVDEMKINRIRPNGANRSLILKKQELFIERSALTTLPLKPGDEVTVELSNGKKRTLRVADIVYDVTAPPYIFTQQINSYANLDTLEWLGGGRDYNTLYLTVAENKRDEDHVKAVAKEVADKIERSGRTVYFIFVYQPGRHWATDITQALGMMMNFLGILSVFLSAFLVINTVNAMLSQQVRQIGVMKAIGGKTKQIVGMYLVMVLGFGILAFMLAVPLAAFLGYGVAQFVSKFLNFNLGPFRILPEVILQQAIVALLVPLIATLLPVLKGTRITIREAITNYGLGKGIFGSSWVDKLVEKIRSLPRPMLISLRNTFRRKGRLVLTLTTLTLGGAIFMGVFNLWASLNGAIEEAMGYFLSDVNVSLSRSERIQKLEPIVMSIPGVKNVEWWGFMSGEVLSPDKETSIDVFFAAPPAGSKLIRPVLSAGRWLLPEDENAVVIGNHMVKLRPDLKVGDDVFIKVMDKEYSWRIVGIYQVIGNTISPILYVNYEYLAKITHQSGMTASLRIVTDQHDAASQEQVARMLEERFKQAGSIQVSSITTGAEFLSQQTATTDVLIYFLLIMAILIALVGGLGLMGTMSMNVIERTREIGVMRATGAATRTILIMVIVEGMLIGAISWMLGLIFSLPISIALNYAIGYSMLSAPLNFSFSLAGVELWLIGVLVISALASALPAYNASRLTVREVLAYE